MSEAVALYHKDGRPAGVFYCSQCRAIFDDEGKAAACHGEHLCPCGKKIERRFYAICDECESLRWKEELSAKERARFDKAKKIQESEYTGAMVFLEDGYYECVQDAIDQFLEAQEPEYVWACKDVGIPRANSDSIVENLLERMWEDAEASDIPGLPDLDSALERFNDANKAVHVYFPDYTTAILTKPTYNSQESA